jgi:hypothetical protein
MQYSDTTIIMECIDVSIFLPQLQFKMRASHVEFVTRYPFDGNGYLYYIATSGKTKPWKNPHTTGQVCVNASSKHLRFSDVSGVIRNDFSGKGGSFFTGHNPGQSSSSYDEENPSWVSISLLDNPPILPKYYAVQVAQEGGVGLMNWDLEGSNDGVKWTRLRSHVDDRIFSRSRVGIVPVNRGWEIRSSIDYYSQFRLVSTGDQYALGGVMGLGGFEIYGHVLKTKKLQ